MAASADCYAARCASQNLRSGGTLGAIRPRRMEYDAENFAAARHMAPNLVRPEPSAKSLLRKRFAHSLNPDSLLEVLLGEQFECVRPDLR